MTSRIENDYLNTLDPKARWRAKNRDKCKDYAKKYYRKKRIEQGFEVDSYSKTSESIDTLGPQQLKNYHNLLLENIGLKAENVHEYYKHALTKICKGVKL